MDVDITNVFERFADDMKKRVGQVHTYEPFSASNPDYRQEFFNTEVRIDLIRHFVDGIGDINPLYRDREYAGKTKYGCLLAPPSFLETINYAQHPEGVPPEIRGVLSGSQWEYFRPVCEGDIYTARVIHPSKVELKKSRSGGRIVILYENGDLIRQGGVVTASYSSWVIYMEPSREGGGRTDGSQPDPEYTSEYIKEVYDTQDNEIPRGAETRYWEDVEVGEDLHPVVRGPYTLSERFAWFMGKGNPPACVSDRLYRIITVDNPDKRGIFDPKLNIYKHPSMFDINTGREGQRKFHDAGAQRSSWRNMVFTNWIGDEGFLWKSRAEIRGFNSEGDVTWCKARVTKKYIENGRCCVDIDCWCENQNGEVTMPGTGTVILPSREHGPVRYPDPYDGEKNGRKKQ